MKTTILIFLLIFGRMHLYGHQAVSVKAGDFFTDSVWAGGVQPDLTHDSVFLETDLSFYHEIRVSGDCYFYIGHHSRLCGAHNITITDSAFFGNKGQVYMDTMWVTAKVLNHNYIDAVGLIDVRPPGSYSNDSCGEAYVHAAPQLCAAPALSTQIDTNISVARVGGRLVTFYFNSTACSEVVYFGDGDSAIGNGSMDLNHTYAQYGTYQMSVRSVCILCDTFYFYQSRAIELDSDNTCHKPTKFNVYPNPCDDHCYVFYESCLPGVYQLPLYDDIGQKVTDVTVDNTGRAAVVESNVLASGVYFIKIPETVARSKTWKIVVVH